MSYLIDTDIIIYSIKGNRIVQNHFLQNEHIPKAISVITYGELLSVVYRIKELFPIAAIDNAVIETFSDIKVDMQRAGSPLDDMDLLIAATALTMNYTLVTSNERHFRRIKGLGIENWSKE
jgi:tRNA(fMet)-specific endonuclease VapC